MAMTATFIFNRFGTGADTNHVLSLYGKTSNITREDLLYFAKENSIRDAEKIISEVANALSHFPSLAEKYNIPSRWRHIIQKTIQDNLSKFGFLEIPPLLSEFIDNSGKKFQKLSINTNNKGYYHISTLIDNRLRKRIVKPDSEYFQTLQKYELDTISDAEFIKLIELIFS